jgi:hypothetical protein
MPPAKCSIHNLVAPASEALPALTMSRGHQSRTPHGPIPRLSAQKRSDERPLSNGIRILNRTRSSSVPTCFSSFTIDTWRRWRPLFSPRSTSCVGCGSVGRTVAGAR